MTAVAKTGMLYLILQIVGAIAYSTDSLVIAHFFGATAVAQYAVPDKMFSLIGTVIAMMLAPLWPAYAEALARGDSAWVRRTFSLSLALAFGASLALAIVFVSLVARSWRSVGQTIVSSLSLLCALGCRKIIDAVANAIGFFLNGSRNDDGPGDHRDRDGLILPAPEDDGRARYGVEGVVWASVIPMIGIGIGPAMWVVWLKLARLERRITPPHDSLRGIGGPCPCRT